MTDIVERLRERLRGNFADDDDELDAQAADEIERLLQGRETMGNLWAKEKEARHKAEDEIERLQKGIRDYLNGDYEPKVSNVDKCPHGFYGYEVCEHCTDDHFRKLLGVKT